MINMKLHDGYGKLKYPNGDSYEGYFIEGKKEGYGRLAIKSKNRLYFGEFKNDELNGFGFIVEKEEIIYDGEFKNKKEDGLLLHLTLNILIMAK